MKYCDPELLMYYKEPQSIKVILLFSTFDNNCSSHFVHTTHVTSFCVSYGGHGIPLHFTSTGRIRLHLYLVHCQVLTVEIGPHIQTFYDDTLYCECVHLIRESVDSLCRDGADAQYMQYLSKSRITSPQTRKKLI